ncbi:MAG: hypothetical protein V3576_00850 [Candidatus Cloacimonadota bacterium]
MLTIDKERLFEVYLASLKPGVIEDPEPETLEMSLPEDECFSFEDSGMIFCKTEGSIIVIEAQEYEIWCMVIELTSTGMYKAFKISPFTGFASEYDLLIQAGTSTYLLELDNGFLLSLNEINAGITVGAVAESTFAKVKSRLQHQIHETGHSTDLSSPENRFRIMEHEQTMELRSRYHSAPLWIPQILLQYEREVASVIPAAAAGYYVDEAFEILDKQLDENVYYAKEFTLYKNEMQELILKPDQGYISQKAEIRCGDIVVYRGILPESLILASFLPVSPLMAQRFLDLSLRTLKE